MKTTCRTVRTCVLLGFVAGVLVGTLAGRWALFGVCAGSLAIAVVTLRSALRRG